ncbi:hypothetical protein BSZ35_19085 [Salinibacter sp. 10B]|uniref:hypothetical protein n=1 Tax=Salinibacter sp. 10B TaxID=1923971 RepID=UPI000CF41A89|nr:hypothetical protein [Salinibacter sp. 10B]PQJ26754.1 hypothetical protein BSZ35_19085 [Salinibacter sp. 10B]
MDGRQPNRSYYEATDEDLERAGAAGAEVVLSRLENNLALLEQVELLGRLKTGLITIDDICRLYGVKERTVHDWPLEPADTPTQQNLYRVSEIESQLTA